MLKQKLNWKRVNTITSRLGAHIRRLGFKVSGQTHRRVEDDTIFVINIQLSRGCEVCYINLGAQPTFIPAECSAAFDTLKEYECVMRTRAGKDWPLNPDEQELLALAQAIDDRQRDFFGRARTLCQSLATDSPDELLDKFCAGTTREAATLHLAGMYLSNGFARNRSLLQTSPATKSACHSAVAWKYVQPSAGIFQPSTGPILHGACSIPTSVR